MPVGHWLAIMYWVTSERGTLCECGFLFVDGSLTSRAPLLPRARYHVLGDSERGSLCECGFLFVDGSLKSGGRLGINGSLRATGCLGGDGSR